jgi:hypothetical protein
MEWEDETERSLEMKRAIAASIVAVLLVGSSAMAQIDLQYQTWDVGLSNTVTLNTGGVISASTTQGIGTLSGQTLTSGIATASQGVGVALFQDGSASTKGAAISLTQNAKVESVGLSSPHLVDPGQTQKVAVGGGAILQSQGVQVNGDQTLKKTGTDTAANADGLNLVAFGMGETAANNANDASQGVIILGGSYSEMTGKADSKGTVETTMSATVVQLQQAH